MDAITREEKLMDGQYVEPITRKEKILAGEDLETITREEYFLKKYRGGGGGDITVESLNVTENGTYTAPTGKAYSPVNVELPLSSKTITENGTYTASDDNLAGYDEVTVAVEGYAKKSILNTPTDIATFNASALPMPSLTVGIEATQSGSGDPSPQNVRPISGWDEVNVSVEGGQNLYNDSIVWKNGYYINSSGVETQSNNYKYTQTFIEVEPSTTYSIQADIVALTNLAITVPYYSEQQSFISRDLIANVDIGTRTYKVDFTTPSNCKYIRISVPTDTSNIVIHKKIIITIDLDGTRYGGTLDVVSGVLTVTHGYIASYNGETLPSTWISDRDVYAEGTTPTIGAEVCYELATPQTIQLTPTMVKSLLGTNNLWADSGKVISGEYMEAL